MKRHLYLSCIAFLTLICGGLTANNCQCINDNLTCESTSECSSCNDEACCTCKVTGKTFLPMRGFFDDPAGPPKVSLIRSTMQELQTKNGTIFQMVPFGGKTLNSERLAWYFGPSCKRVLNVASAPGPNVDVLAQQLGIYTQNGLFESKFCLSPKQTFAGIGFNYRTHFGYGDENKGFFLDITLPIYSVENTMNLAEVISNTGGGVLVAGGPANVTEAFRQPSWNFGRIDDCCDTRKTAISMLDVQFGYGWGKEQAHMHSYIGALIPAGNKVLGRKVFEPIVGWDHHAAIHFGSSLGIKIWQDECADRSIWYELAIDSRYFFENKQYRSFDLKGKPWSRYMTVYANAAQAQEAFIACGSPALCAGQTSSGLVIGTPGINIFTQEVKVKPRFQRTYNTAFVVDLKDLTLEGGYNFFSNDQECVKLACPWEKLVGITQVLQPDGTYIVTDGPALKAVLNGCGCTNAYQTINDDVPGQIIGVALYNQSIITADQIDFSSAEAPGSLRHWIYGSIGYTIDRCDVRTLIGLGAGYEFCGDDTSVNRLGAWGKIAVIF